MYKFSDARNHLYLRQSAMYFPTVNDSHNTLSYWQAMPTACLPSETIQKGFIITVRRNSAYKLSFADSQQTVVSL